MTVTHTIKKKNRKGILVFWMNEITLTEKEKKKKVHKLQLLTYSTIHLRLSAAQRHAHGKVLHVTL